MSQRHSQVQLSVIIVNYNVKYFLEQCLISVLKACKNIDAEIFVADNNSTDGSRDFFVNKFLSVKFIWNTENVGFAKANNQVIKQCKGDYILFLNPDTLLPEDSFDKCIAFIEAQQKPGAIGVRLIDGSGNFLKESKRAFPSPLTSLFKLSGLTALFPYSKTFAKYYLGNLDENQNHEVDVLVGAFMLMPKTVLEITGSFDESFFMYGEDVDLSYRIQKAGFKNYYFSETTVIHFKGESTKKGSLNYIRLFYKAMVLFVKKHYSSGVAGFYTILMQLAIWIRAIIAGILGLFKNLFLSFNKQKNESLKAMLVGSEKDCNALSFLVQKKIIPKEIIGHVGILSELPASVKKPAVEGIIFCEGSLSFKEIIDAIRQSPGAVSYQFYAAGSHSIIGSDSKDSSGDAIALD